MLRDRTILLALAGSRAHGTATPDSDVDLLGVAVPSRRQVLGAFHPFEQANAPEEMAAFRPDLREDERAIAARTQLEGTVYGLAKFLKLAAQANPNILEVLFCREAEVRRTTPLGTALRAQRDLFVSAKCRHTFGGYAANQLGRIQLHYRWHHDGPEAPPARADFGLPEQTTLPKVRIEVEDRVARRLAEMGLAADEARWRAAARHVGLDDNLLEVMQKERAWRAARDEWQRYRRWKARRNPERAALEASYGYDTKHGAHLVRLLRMGHEILTTGQVHVWRGDRDAEELKQIRAGAWSYERLLAWSAEARARLDAAESVVKSRPDRERIDALCADLTERALALEVGSPG